MAEAVAQVEEGPLSSAIFNVSLDEPQLGANAMLDRGLAEGLISGEQGRAVGFAPCEEGSIVNQAIFDDFRIAGAQLPRIERFQECRIGDDQGRLMEAPDKILLP